MTRGVHLSVSYPFAFSYCSWGSQASILKWFTIPFSIGPHSVRPLHHDPFVHLGWPHMAWLSFIELDMAVVHVVRLASFL